MFQNYVLITVHKQAGPLNPQLSPNYLKIASVLFFLFLLLMLSLPYTIIFADTMTKSVEAFKLIIEESISQSRNGIIKEYAISKSNKFGIFSVMFKYYLSIIKSKIVTVESGGNDPLPRMNQNPDFLFL
jgi:hypothetical protein